MFLLIKWDKGNSSRKTEEDCLTLVMNSKSQLITLRRVSNKIGLKNLRVQFYCSLRAF